MDYKRCLEHLIGMYRENRPPCQLYPTLAEISEAWDDLGLPCRQIEPPMPPEMTLEEFSLRLHRGLEKTSDHP